MATVKAIKYGMKGDNVSDLQSTLNNLGYSLDVDGSFGPQTLQAVKDYQQKNGLTVDGMVGPQTQAALFGGTSGSTPANTTPTSGNASGGTSGNNTGSGSTASPSTQLRYPNMPSYDEYVSPEYATSETVQQANAALNVALAAQPGAYQSKWQSQIDDIIGRILNREAFNYDFNEDVLYQQYAEQYQRRGKLAMQDTMGQAAAMTGGYGSSYASTAGNQAYQEYLSQLNEVIPELYGMALQRYQMEGQDMYNQYGMLSAQEQQDYARYMDEYNKWLGERDYAAGRYDSERNFDYGKHVDDRNFDYQVHADKENREFEEYLTAVQNAQWDAQFEEGIREYEENMKFNREQADIANAQWEQSFEESQRQNEVSNEQWKTSRQDKIDSENRAYAREDVMNVISSGGTPTDAQLEAAGMSKETAQAMAAISSGDEEEALKHVGSMTYPQMEEALSAYVEAGKVDEAKSMMDHLYDAGMITDEEYKKMLSRYIYTSTHPTTDTTVAGLPSIVGIPPSVANSPYFKN